MAKQTVDEIFDLIARDGLWEVVKEVNPKRVENEHLAELLQEAQELMDRIEAFVEDNRFAPESEHSDDEEEGEDYD
jgi:hypothetical protein